MMKQFHSWVVGSLATLTILLVSVAPAHAVKVENVVSPGGIEAWLVRENSIPIKYDHVVGATVSSIMGSGYGLITRPSYSSRFL